MGPRDSCKEREGGESVSLWRQGVVVFMMWLVLATAARGQLSVDGAYVRGLPPGQSVTAAFLTFVNTGDQPLVIRKAVSPQVARIEFHQHTHEDGMMRMRPLGELTVPAGGELTLAPGGVHLMLMGLSVPLVDGDVVSMVFSGDGLQSLEVQMPVISVLRE